MKTLVLLLKALKSTKKEIYKCFVVEVVDTVIEEIFRASERNDFKESQRRISHVRFLSEAFNYKLIHTDTLFVVMYKLINYDITQRKVDE